MMCADTRSAGLDSVELGKCLELYDIEDYLFDEVRKRFEEKDTLEPFDFFAIVAWKSNRTKTKIRRGLDDAGKTVQGLMSEVAQAETSRDKVEVLLQVWGIGLAMASAILTVCDPETFTVLDYRAWETLRAASVQGLPEDYPATPDEYLDYCRVCRQLAERVGMSLRNLDRALWAKSWRDDLRKLVHSS
jgi:thermostable 8-oxoguanine DNA glycosylase